VLDSLHLPRRMVVPTFEACARMRAKKKRGIFHSPPMLRKYLLYTAHV
jgi:hypothetical protein